MEFKYDVFLSYSRRDYVDQMGNPIPGNPISAITEMFDRNGITYWIDKNGIYSGQEFVEAIMAAIEASKMVVFVSSEASNSSRWTVSEVFEASDSSRTIIPVLIDATPYNKKLKFLLRPLDYVDFRTSRKSGLESLLRAINKVKKDIREFVEKEEEDRKKQELEAKKLEVLKEIKGVVEDYKRLSIQQDTLYKDIIAKNHLVGKNVKECPVCGKQSPLEASWCDRCGFSFPPLYALEGAKVVKVINNHHISFFRTIWQSFNSLTKKLEDASTEREKLLSRIDELSKEKAKLEDNKKHLEESMSRSLDLEREWQEEKRDYLMRSESKMTELRQLICDLQVKNDELIKRQSIITDASVYFNTPPKISIPLDNCAVILKNAGQNKLQVIARVKDILGISLKEAKNIVDKAPVTIKVYSDYGMARHTKSLLENYGASVEIRKESDRSLMKNQEKAFPSDTYKYKIVLIHKGSYEFTLIKKLADVYDIDVTSAKALVDSSPVILHPEASNVELFYIAQAVLESGGRIGVLPIEIE